MLESFEAYLLREYNDNNAVCVKFKYSHSIKTTVDKVSKTPLIHNIITVKIDSYDAHHKLIASHSEKFVDGEIKRTKANPLVNIAPAELNNKFAAAKAEIATLIMNEYDVKLDEVTTKINQLNAYVHVDHVIPNQFVNEPVVGTDAEATSNVIKQFEF